MSDKLPSRWQKRSLASLGHYENGFAFNELHWSERGLPIIRIAQITGSQGIVDRYPGRLLDTFRLDDGDLIFSWSGTLAVVKWNGGPAWLNQHLFKVLPTTQVDSSFLFHVLQASVSEMNKRTHGSTMKHIKRGELRELIVNIPNDKSEQEKIAQVLDTLDTAIFETEAIIAKLKAVKQGLLHDLLTRGIDANGELRPPQADAPHLYKESPVGWIPRDWEIAPLGDACSAVVDCPHSTPHFQDTGVLLARTMHIKEAAFLESEASMVSEKEYGERIARLKPEAGDLIFTREAPVGEAFVIPPGMRICLGQRVMLLRPRQGRLVAEFLLAQIYSGAVKDRIAALTSGTTNPHLNVSEVKDFEMPLPEFSEQQQIADQVSSLERRICRELATQRKLTETKSGIMDDLLTGRVRVTPLLTDATP